MVYHKLEHALVIKKKKNAGVHCHINEAKSITPSKISQSPLEEIVCIMILSVLQTRQSWGQKGVLGLSNAGGKKRNILSMEELRGHGNVLDSRFRLLQL